MKSAMTLHSSATLSSAVPADRTATVPATCHLLISQSSMCFHTMFIAVCISDASKATRKQYPTDCNRHNKEHTQNKCCLGGQSKLLSPVTLLPEWYFCQQVLQDSTPAQEWDSQPCTAATGQPSAAYHHLAVALAFVSLVSSNSAALPKHCSAHLVGEHAPCDTPACHICILSPDAWTS